MWCRGHGGGASYHVCVTFTFSLAYLIFTNKNVYFKDFQIEKLNSIQIERKTVQKTCLKKNIYSFSLCEYRHNTAFY